MKNNRYRKKIPHHIAVIMDGNRRWAKKQGKSVMFGHQWAVDNVLESLVDEGIVQGIECMTFWAWSTENWKRSKVEITAVMKLFRKLFDKQLERLYRKGARVQTIGDISAFDPDIQEKVANLIERTKDNKKITVVFAINYGGHDEILRAAKKIHELGIKNQELNEERFEEFLDTSKLPQVDLIIRPGGEKRLSGFLLWQSAYAELYFTDVLFPDFGPEELQKALKDYQDRNRRYGE